jgi:DNA replication protein DnaC
MKDSRVARPDASVKATNPWQRHQPTANAVIDSGRRVAWFTQESLTVLLGRAKVDDSMVKVVSRVTQGDRVVIDASGMPPAGQDAAGAFYRPVDSAHERRSIAVSSNRHPSDFDTSMPQTLAAATVDRFLHYAQVVLTDDSSPRLAEATAGTGVMLLA